MTAIEPVAAAPVVHTDDRSWAMKVRRAEVMARSKIVPEYFQNKPDEILVAALGLEAVGVEFNPNTLKQVYVIAGKPGYMAQLQIALAAKHGHEIVLDETSDAATATVHLRKCGDKTWHKVTFTMDEAKTSGLYNKPGDMYKKWPADMLAARVVTRAIKQHVPGVLLGIESTVTFDDATADRTTAIRERCEAPSPADDDPGRPFE